ncbi:DNA methyltransferase [Serratia marcescens]|uniref:DNA methyltransferase n=1 Tax=Serratia marcescens TaxID=615 RepID=UPI003003645A
MCELAYRWFSPEGGTVIDPFAGGSVRGVVAAKLGRQYLGCDLRSEQVEANRQQWVQIDTDGGAAPHWHCGDSRDIHQHFKGAQADFLFSCPPYADLEVYSDDPADISTLNYPEFVIAYRQIIKNALSLLKEDRFACFVVGEVRDAKGIYRNFVSDTVLAFCDAGAAYYNEAILVTQAGSLPVRAGKMFSASRKLGKTHQNVLVFVKGDPRKAVEACGVVDVTDIFPDEPD